MKKLKLKIDGIHCKSCILLIKDALSEIGVNKSEISLYGDAEIDFDDKISESKVIEAIKSQGYKVRK